MQILVEFHFAYMGARAFYLPLAVAGAIRTSVLYEKRHANCVSVNFLPSTLKMSSNYGKKT